MLIYSTFKISKKSFQFLMKMVQCLVWIAILGSILEWIH